MVKYRKTRLDAKKWVSGQLSGAVSSVVNYVIRRNGFGVLEQAVRTLKVARHHIPDLPRFEIYGKTI
jgi:stage V sporulation protein SpoVS